jgi:hypothetical protein
MTSALQLPLEKFTAEQRNSITEAVATTFCLEKTGTDKTKDFFVCGLLSLEEIQMGLPRLLPTAVVEDAVTRVIRKGAPLMTDKEWQTLVLAVRTPQACGQAVEEQPPVAPVDEDSAPRSPAPRGVVVSSSPAQSPISHSRGIEAAATAIGNGIPMNGMPNTPALQSREVREATAQSSETALSGLPFLASPMLDFRSIRSQDQWIPQEGDANAESRPRLLPVTEPLPCRNVRSEEPVNFTMGGASAARGQAAVFNPSRLVDWNTAVPGESGAVAPALAPSAAEASREKKEVISWHKADEGAGTRLTWGTSCFKQELANAAGRSTCSEPAVLMPGGADPAAWISIDLHECGGPYLAQAFVRCCHLFTQESRKRNSR